jgi:hypothetical protein
VSWGLFLPFSLLDRLSVPLDPEIDLGYCKCVRIITNLSLTVRVPLV